MIAKFRTAAAWLARARAGRAAGLVVLLASGGHRAVASGPAPELTEFDRYTSLSSYGELARRLLSPLEAGQFMRRLRDSGGSADSQPLDVTAERFLVHVPPRQPEPGYALLVFVSPWQEARLPAPWAPILDQRGFVFVTAAHSGNDQGALSRREPLALLAASNVLQRYRIDPRRVYVGGFSGGARVALRLALGYPDVFRGALLNAGSDVIGDALATPPVPLPPRDLLYRFQESSRLVYVTGARDLEHLTDDRLSVRSLTQWCIYDHDQFELPRQEHEIADATGLARALDALDSRADVDMARLRRCREALQAELDTKFGQLAALLASGQRDAAGRLVGQLDRRYGGLAGPRTLEFPPPE